MEDVAIKECEYDGIKRRIKSSNQNNDSNNQENCNSDISNKECKVKIGNDDSKSHIHSKCESECLKPDCFIGSFKDAPGYTQKCPYILYGYRIGFTNVKRVLKSLFMVHNETTNIWSHILGVFIYVFLIVYLVFWTAPDVREGLSENSTILGVPVSWIISINRFIAKYILWIDGDVATTHEVTKIPILIHMFGNIVCMTMSSTYHLFCCHSEYLSCTLHHYDYAGISVMIACSIYPPYFYGFLCKEMIHWGYFYTGIINISSLALVILCVHPKIDYHKYRKLRTVLYCVVGLSCGVPGFHYLIADPVYISYSNLFLWSLGGFFFIFGAYVYYKKFPERKYPGRFDYFGQSHNIWHLFVLLGGITHFFASLANYYGRRMQQCPVSA